MSNGWIKLHRKIQEHWIWNTSKPFDKRSAWIDILLMVNHEKRKIVLGNELIEVDRGERVTSERKLAERWGWSRTKVRNFLELLEQDEMITVKKPDRKRTRIKVLNYNDYQQSENHKKTNKKPDKNQSRTTREPVEDINKNDKNDKNEKNEKENKDIPPCPYQEIQNLYNTICKSLPSVRVMSDRRKEHLRARWKEVSFNLSVFEQVFKQAEASDFLTGNNDRGWKADFDWIIKNNHNFGKVLEGKYSNRKGHKEGQKYKWEDFFWDFEKFKQT